MKNWFNFLMFFFLYLAGHHILAQSAQNIPKRLPPKVENVSNGEFLSEKEKEIINLINQVRQNAPFFADTYLKKLATDTSRNDIQSVIDFLYAQKPINPLKISFPLYKSALLHARDMGLAGKTGHIGTGGMGYKERIAQYFPATKLCAENFYVGSGEPLDIIVSFLSGKNANSLEYRNNLFNPDLEYIGVSLQAHRYYCHSLVVNFAQKPEVPPGVKAQPRNPINIYWKDCPPGVAKKKTKKNPLIWFAGLFKKSKRK